jgi:hypothetical protein
MEKKMFAFTSMMAGFFCLVIFSSFSKKEETVTAPMKKTWRWRETGDRI